MLEMQLHGIDPGLSHGINVLFHVLNVALVGWLSWLVLKERSDRGLWASLLALYYGFHPAMTESVAFISSRFDLMMTSFLLLALVADLSLRRKTWPRVLAVSLLFLAAVLCKEMAAAFILVLVLWYRVLPDPATAVEPAPRRPRIGDQVLILGGVVLSGLLYLLIRYLSMGYLLDIRNSRFLEVGVWGNHLLLVFKSLGRYAAIIIWPFTMVRPIHFSELPVSSSDWQAWTTLAGGLILLFLWIRYRRQLGTLPVWFTLPLLAMLPVINLVPLPLTGGAFAADRYVSFPLVLFTVAVGAALGRPRAETPHSPQKVVLWLRIVMLAWIVASAAVVRFSVLPRWENERALWAWGVQIAPRSSIPHTNLSGEYSAAGDYDSGLREARIALKLDRNYVDAMSNMAVALMGQGRLPEAITSWERAVSLRGDCPNWTNLAAGYRMVGRFDDSIRALKEHALVMNPRDGYAILNLGMTYQAAGRPDLAIPYLERSIPLLPPAEAEVARQRLQMLHGLGTPPGGR